MKLLLSEVTSLNSTRHFCFVQLLDAQDDEQTEQNKQNKQIAHMDELSLGFFFMFLLLLVRGCFIQ